MITRVLTLLSSLLVGLACGDIAEDMAEEFERQRHTQKFVFDDPIERLWSEMVVVTRENGAICPKQPHVGATVECSGSATSLERTWMHVRMTQHPGGHRVELIEMSERNENGAWVPKPGKRSHELEWTLVSRLHPEEAERIAAAAEAKRPSGRSAWEDFRNAMIHAFTRRDDGSADTTSAN